MCHSNSAFQLPHGSFKMIVPGGIFGCIWHPAGLASGAVNCLFNTWLGLGHVSLEGVGSLKVTYVLLAEQHMTFPAIKISIHSWQSASVNSLGWVLRLAGPLHRSDFIIGHCLSECSWGSLLLENWLLVYYVAYGTEIRWPNSVRDPSQVTKFEVAHPMCGSPKDKVILRQEMLVAWQFRHPLKLKLRNRNIDWGPPIDHNRVSQFFDFLSPA